MLFKLLPLSFGVLSVLSFAQDRTILGGPISGLVFDSGQQALRLLIGVPGAAYLGPALMTGIEAAAVAPETGAALVVRAGRTSVYRGANVEPSMLELDAAIEAPDVFAWSSDGSLAAMYCSGNQTAQIWKNLMSAPELSLQLSLHNLEGKVTALAVATSSDHLVAAVRSGENAGTVFLLQPGRPPDALLSTGGPVSLAVSGSDLFIADRNRDEIRQISQYRHQAASMIFAGPGRGVASPVGMQISGDGKRLFVANAGDRSMVFFDRETRAIVHRMALEAEPETLGWLGTRSIWLLNSGVEGVRPWLIADGGASPGVYFVPAGRVQ